KVLQRRLNEDSPTRLPRLSADGVYDVLTAARVMEFQHSHKLTADGVVGEKTWEARKSSRADNTGHHFIPRACAGDRLNNEAAYRSDEEAPGAAKAPVCHLPDHLSLASRAGRRTMLAIAPAAEPGGGRKSGIAGRVEPARRVADNPR